MAIDGAALKARVPMLWITRIRLALLVVGGVVLLAFPLVFTNPFPQNIMILIFMYALIGSGWNIVGGYAGQVSFGHSVFFAVGAYTSTVLLVKWGISPWLGMFAGIAIAAAVAVVIGYPCFKLAGHYFVIATIAIGEIGFIILQNWEFVGRAVGLSISVKEDSLANMVFLTSKVPYYYIALALAALGIGVMYAVDRSWFGYSLKAIRDDPDAARSLGINLTCYKLAAMILSAGLASVGGTFYAQYVTYIDPPSVLSLMLSTTICLVAVMGGVGTVWGAVIGSIILVPLSEFTRSFLGGGGKAMDLVIYGLLIMFLAVYQPWGLLALYERLKERFQSRFREEINVAA